MIPALVVCVFVSACDGPFGLFADEEEKEQAVMKVTKNEDVLKAEENQETLTITVESEGAFAEDVTEDMGAIVEEPEENTEETQPLEPEEPPKATNIDKLSVENGESVSLDPNWEYASFSKINSGTAVFYKAPGENRCGIRVGINAGHGTKGGTEVKTYCHPDMTPKVTGGTTAAGSIEAVAVSGGMSFKDGTSEASMTLKLARLIRDKLLEAGYDVLMLRDGDDVQLDNVARTVICNNVADCHVSIHFDGDGLDYDKGCFYISVPDGIKGMPPVDRTYHMSDELGAQIVKALGNNGCKISGNGSMAIDLTQTSYSTIPSVDVEFGNQCTDLSDEHLNALAEGTVNGIEAFYNVSN